MSIACSGRFGDIIDRHYKEVMNDLHLSLLDILKEQLEPFKQDLEDEINFFFMLLEILIKKDFSIKNTLDNIRDSLIFHINPRKFENMEKIIQDKIDMFDSVYKELINERNKIMNSAKDKVKQRKEYLDNLKIGVKKKE